jgi:hypothetical protein
MDDPAKYLRMRKVSGDFSLMSATLPSGQYAVNGILNSVKLAYVPENMGTASFDQLLPYAETPAAKRINVSVAEGIVCYLPERDENSYFAPLTLTYDGRGYGIKSMV